MDTSGFYKVDESGQLLYAPNFVYAPKFSLTRKEKDTYKEPVEGWKWFDSEELAKEEYKIVPETVTMERKVFDDIMMQVPTDFKVVISNEKVVSIGVKENG